MPRLLRTTIPLALSVLLAAAPGAAQSVSPAIIEHRGEARSSFEIVNESLFPLTVVLEARGFRVTDTGEFVDLPLDTARIRLKLSAMSFRVPPQGSYTVFYEAKASELPSWFFVLAAITGARTRAGINLRLELPHVVYLLQKERLREGEVVVRSFGLDSARRNVLVELENSGPNLGRVRAAEALFERRSVGTSGGMPLFPRSRRRLVIPWDGSEQPDRVVVRFEDFTVESTRDAARTASSAPSVPPE